VLDRLGPVPATGLDGVAVGALLALTGLAAVGGLLAFEHRDLASA
jgi:hypothetical protein